MLAPAITAAFGDPRLALLPFQPLPFDAPSFCEIRACDLQARMLSRQHCRFYMTTGSRANETTTVGWTIGQKGSITQGYRSPKGRLSPPRRLGSHRVLTPLRGGYPAELCTFDRNGSTIRGTSVPKAPVRASFPTQPPRDGHSVYATASLPLSGDLPFGPAEVT